MKKTKVLIILLVSIFILSSVMTGCGSSNSNSTASTNDAGTSQSTEKTSEVKDLGTIVIAAPDWGGTWGNVEENKLVQDAINEKMIADRNEKITIDLKAYPGSNFEEKLNVLLAGGEAIDGFTHWYPWNGFITYASKPGLCMPLNELLKSTPAMKALIPEEAWQSVTLNGTIMAIPDFMFPQTYGLYIRKDILDAANVPVPKTVDDMTKALAALKAAGKTGFNEDMQSFDRFLAGAYGIPFKNYQDANGVVLDRLFHPNFTNYLSLLNSWYAEGYIPKDFLNVKLENIQTNFASDKAGVYNAWYNWIDGDYVKLKVANPKAEVAVIAPLTSEIADSGLAGEEPEKNVLFLLNSAKNAKGVMEFMDWRLSSVENNLLCEVGVNGVHYNADLAKMTMSPAEAYADPNKKKYGGTFILGGWYSALFAPFKTISTDPIKQKASDLSFEMGSLLSKAKIVKSATLGLPITLSADGVKKETDFVKKAQLLQAQVIMGTKTIAQFETEKTKLLAMYKPVSDEYTAKIKELTGK